MNPCYPGNHLLHALLASCAELWPRVEPVDMSAGRILQAAGTSAKFLYFPVDALLSAQQLLTDGYVTEIASVGKEGMTGVASCLHASDLPASQVVVSLPGCGYQLETGRVREALRQSDALQALLLRYAYSLLTQLGHNHACAGHHNTGQRICCWLLYTALRLERDDIHITQEQLGNILGVRREGVAQVLGRLREQGALLTQRATLSIVDHAQLQARSCECYGLLRAELELLRGYLAAPLAALPLRRTRPALDKTGTVSHAGTAAPDRAWRSAASART